MSNEAPVQDPKNGDANPRMDLLGHVIAKIQDQWFLFAIGVILVLLGLTVRAADLGSEDLRFFALLIAVVTAGTMLFRLIWLFLEMKTQGRPAMPPPTVPPATIQMPPSSTAKPSERPMQEPPQASVATRSVLPADPTLRASLERQLVQRQRTLQRLEEQAAVFPEGSVPVHLLNQIEVEQVRIREIQEQLAR